MDAISFSTLLRERLAKSGEASFIGQGVSMLPTFPPSARLHLAPLAADDPSPGRVYAFVVAPRLLVHRLLEVRDGACVFRGDNRGQTQVVRDRSDVVGRVVAFSVLGLTFELDSAGARILSGFWRSALGIGRVVPRSIRGFVRRRLIRPKT